jgi:hypothetical protein
MKRALGRGLGALLPPAETTEEGGGRLRDLPVDSLIPNPQQPRRSFDEQALGELAASIRASGILQPLVVRPRGSQFEILVGERRIVLREQAEGIADIIVEGFAQIEIEMPGLLFGALLVQAMAADKGGRQAQLAFQNVPSDWVHRLQVVVMADRPAMLDVVCSAPLTNGSVVWLDGGTRWERNYYFAAVGWSVTNLLAHATNPVIRLQMLPVR